MRVNNTRPNVQGGGVERILLNDLQSKTDLFDGDVGERKNPAPDGGWGWAVVAGTALVMAFVPAILLCLGLILLELKEDYPSTSYAQLAVIPAILFAAWNSVGALNSVFIGIVSCRTATLVGGLMMTIGVSVTFYARNIEFFYITFATLGGVGAGLSLSPGAVLLSQYFTKRKDVATSACLVAGTAGQVFMPHILVSLSDAYSIQGALLVIGGLLLHVCVAAALFRPLREPAHYRRSSMSRGSHRRVNLYTRDPTTGKTHVTKVILIKSKKGVQGQIKKKLAPPPDELDSTANDRQWRNPSSLVDTAGNAGRFYRVRTYSNSSRFLPDIPEEKEPSTDAEESEEPTEESNLQEDNCGRSGSVVRFRLDSDASDCNGNAAATATVEMGPSLPPLPPNPRERTDSNCSTSSVTSAISYLGSCNSICSDHLQIEAERCKRLPNRPLCLRVVDSKLLSNPIFWVLAASATFHNVAFPNVLLLVPFRANKLGLTSEETAYVLSFCALGEVFGRLLVPWLSQRLSPQFIFLFLGTFSIAGVAGLGLSLSFLSLGACSSVFGFTSGACTVVLTPILFSYLGKVQFSFALIVSQCLQAACFLIVTPLLGLLVDETSNMLYVFYVLVCLQALSVITWIAEPIAVKCQNRQNRSQTYSDHSCS